MPKIKVTFDKRRISVNGQVSARHDDGNMGRTVYITHQFVIKVDDRGYDHDDMSAWKSIQPRDRKYFIPTLAQGRTPDGNRWSLQPFMEMDDEFTEEALELAEKLVDKYHLYDIDIFYSGGPRNWAMHDGHPLFFDYGMT